MSTLIYCDTDDCQNSDHGYDKGIFSISRKAAEELIKKKYIYSKYDTHICRDCVENYYNEVDEQLIIVDDEIELGKDFIGVADENSI